MKKRIVKQTYKDTSTVTKLTLIAKRVQEHRVEKLTSLMHLLNQEYLMDCYTRLKKRKAAGVDLRTVESYTEEEITKVIGETIQKMKTRDYQPQPVRKVLIPKGKAKLRTLGIPTVTDKIVQLGMTRILNSIFDSSFLPCSFGYRVGKDAHACLKEVNHMIMQQKVNYIVDCDIKEFFDHIDHQWMTKCISERISDKPFLQLIWKFLKSGVMTEGQYRTTKEGTPQGGIISPVLANIYMHYVLDLWMIVKEKKKMKGYIKLIRYADDFIIGVQYEEDAEILVKDIGKRLNKFGLELSKEKTKIIEFGRFASENRERRRDGKPDTFDFLGFTHYCSETHDGRFMVHTKTSKKRLYEAVTTINNFLKTNKNRYKLENIWEKITLKLTGHYNYYGVSGNFEEIKIFYEETRRLIFKWLNRRSRKKSFSWEKFTEYISFNPLPKPRLTYAIYNTW
jgi:group II intron reverse transcriptase/maturase